MDINHVPNFVNIYVFCQVHKWYLGISRKFSKKLKLDFAKAICIKLKLCISCQNLKTLTADIFK